jgi:hypothetical protein
MNRISDVGLHAEPKTRQDTCDTHGAFEAKCFLGSVWTKCPACAAEAAEREKAESEKKKRRLDITELVDSITQSWNIQEDEIDHHERRSDLEGARERPPTNTPLALFGFGWRIARSEGQVWVVLTRVGHPSFLAVQTHDESILRPARPREQPLFRRGQVGCSTPSSGTDSMI